MERPINVRITDRTAEKLDQGVAISGRTKAQLMRQALEIGLAELEAVGFDLEGFAIQQIQDAKAEAQRQQGIPSKDALRAVKKSIKAENTILKAKR